MTAKCIIIGASHAAAMLAPTLRQQGWAGEIIVIGEEPVIPYHRPPLSKDYLAGEKSLDEIFIRPAAVYEKAEVAFMLNTRVETIDRDRRVITLGDDNTLGYDKLVLCTGSRVRKVDLPGVNLGNIHYLRDLSDVDRINTAIKPGGNAVIVGGGYIGLETAAVLNRLGMKVTVVEMLERVMQRVTAPEVSAFYTRVHTTAGVEIRCNTGVSGFAGNGSVEQVLCGDGTSIPADLVIIGIGIVPNLELAVAAGLETDNGIKVNAQTQTSDPDIYAAGDCTFHFNPVYDRWIRLESVQNASDQARVTAAAICDKDAEYNALPWFWSDQYDLKLQIAGLSQGYDEVITRGDMEGSHSFAAFYLREDRIIAVDAVNKAPEFMFGKKLITEGVLVDKKRLADSDVPVKELIA